MKKTVVFCFAIITAITLRAQKPITWSFTAEKISNKIYQIHLKAVIQNGWHLYAQIQPDSFIGVPTSIKFNKNPLLVIDGKTKEVGRLELSRESSLDSESWRYNKEVDFVQKVILKSKNTVKTNLSGSIEFQLCTDEMCLPPATISFTVPVK